MAKAKGDGGKKFWDMLEARGRRNEAQAAEAAKDKRPIKEQAAERKADLQYGYPKKGMKFGTVDMESGGGIAESRRGSRITKSAVSGVDAGSSARASALHRFITDRLDPLRKKK